MVKMKYSYLLIWYIIFGHVMWEPIELDATAVKKMGILQIIFQI